MGSTEVGRVALDVADKRKHPRKYNSAGNHASCREDVRVSEFRYVRRTFVIQTGLARPHPALLPRSSVSQEV